MFFVEFKKMSFTKPDGYRPKRAEAVKLEDGINIAAYIHNHPAILTLYYTKTKKEAERIADLWNETEREREEEREEGKEEE